MIDPDPNSDLLEAARIGRSTRIADLLAAGAAIETGDEEGNTPLILAASNGHDGTVALLLDKGADIEAQDFQGNTALIWAATKGYAPVVGLLVEKGADVQARAFNGETALYRARKAGHAEVVAILDKSRRGETPPGASPPATWFDTMAPGTMLEGNYKITGVIGRGGMGVVYAAMDETLERRVAIKRLLKQGDNSSPDQRSRFLQEARLVAKLNHANIAEIYAVIHAPEPLLVFEFLEGESLQQALDSHPRMSPSQARSILAQIGSALDFAHSHKVIHRDIKPSNVMVDKAGLIKILDFGLAYQSHTDRSQTYAGPGGTFPYMAPEQFMGSVSKSSDIYSLGVVAYELFCGQIPFNGPDFLDEKVHRRFPAATKVNETLPEGLDLFFSKALEPDPSRRHRDAKQFLADLDAALNSR